MQIIQNKSTVFRFPTAWIVNRFTAGFIRRKLKKKGLNFTRKQMKLLTKALKEYRRDHKEWSLIEVHRTSGELVEIRL